MKTRNEIAKGLVKGFTTIKVGDDNSDKRRTIIKPDVECRDFLLNLIFDVNEITSLDSDSVYDFTSGALEAIADTSDDEELIRERLMELEPDVYISNLTDWLGRSNYNLCYLGDAIESGAKGGFTALVMAQKAAMDEVAEIVLTAVLEEYDGQDEDE